MNYLERFQRFAEQASGLYQLTGEFLLCEVIKPDEFSKKVVREDGSISKLIIATAPKRQIDTIAGDAPVWLRVLLCGEGYYNQETDPDTGTITETHTPLDAQPGDIILVPSIAVRKFSIFGGMEGYEPDSICLTRASEIQLKFNGQSGYDAAFAVLNHGQAAAQSSS